MVLVVGLACSGCGGGSFDDDGGLRDASIDGSGVVDEGMSGDASMDAGVDEPFPDAIESALLLNDGQPMPCADPTVVSVRNEGEDFYVFCTGMLRIWHTTDWETFEDVRPTTTFPLTGLGTQAQAINWWWAPSVIYDAGSGSYVMWVSIPSEASTGTAGGTNARSLGVFTADVPTGPWSYEGDAITGAAMQMYIDPFLFRDQMVDSGDRGILQVVRTADLTEFANGGAGGAEFLGARASYLLYAAAPPFESNPATRYLMLDPLSWANGAPFVDTDGHQPTGY